MKHIDPKDLSVNQIYSYLCGGISPRPIALISSISKDGIKNLSPFSFFNGIGSNPPTIAFSVARKRDGSFKDTYNNIEETKECVVNAVTYSMVEQINIASTEYDSDVDEFVKSGFNTIDSLKVKAQRVKESPFQMECELKQIINFGEGKGSGNLIVCEVVMFHIAEDVILDNIIHPDLINLVGRSAGSFYTRTNNSSIFKVERPLRMIGMGYDELPNFIKESHVFSANDLGKFASFNKIPTKEDVLEFINSFEILESTEEQFYRYQNHNDYENMLKVSLFLLKAGHKKTNTFIELSAKCALLNNNIEFAWKTAIYSNLAIKKKKK